MNTLEIKTSIINILQPIHQGVTIHVALTLNNTQSFEAVYWLHPENIRLLEIEKPFLDLFEIESTNELSFYEDLMDDIDTLLPDRDVIFNELLSEENTQDT